MTEPQLRVHDSPAGLAADVAERLLVVLKDAQAAGRTPQIALTGGTIADTIHETLARVASSSQVDWSDVVVWWGDERFVAPDSEDRNALQVRRALLDHLEGLDPANVHEVPSTADADTAEEAAEAYAETVRTRGTDAFDVVMLGLGPDGHVASLFPGFEQLRVHDRIAVAVHDSPKPPPDRVSLTFPALNRTRAVWFVVSGEGKADAVARALHYGATDAGAPAGPESAPTPEQIAEVPARGVTGQEETLWFLDREAASGLQ